MRKVFGIFTLALVLILSFTLPAWAAWQADILVHESSGTAYTMLPLTRPTNVANMVTNNYIALTGAGPDTRVQQIGTERAHMLANDRLLFALPVPASSTQNLFFTTGNTNQATAIISGYNGYVSMPYNAALDLGSSFEIEQGGWVDVSAGYNKNLVYEQYSYRTYISAAGSITSAIGGVPAFATVAATNGGANVVNSTDHTINLPAGIAQGNLLIVLFSADGNPSIDFPSGWTTLFNDLSVNSLFRFSCWYKIADGTEGVSITATTSNAQMSSHNSYRITGFSGLPEVATSVLGIGANPDPPSLTPSWGAYNTLWLAVQGADQGGGVAFVTFYPAGYGGGINNSGGGLEGTSTGSAQRNLNAIAEDPGTFTINAPNDWVANTIAIAPEFTNIVAATAAGVVTGVRTVKTTYDGAVLTIIVDEGLPTQITGTGNWVGTVPVRGFPWRLAEGNSMPYMTYYNHSVGGPPPVLIVWYEPVTVITGATLPDREAPAQNGAFVWGTNPVGIALTMSSLESTAETAIISPESIQPSVLGETNPPVDLIIESETMGQNLPWLYPIIRDFADLTGQPIQLWWFALCGLFILLFMGAAHKALQNLFLTSLSGVLAFGMCVGMAFLPSWIIIAAVVIILGLLALERSPSL